MTETVVIVDDDDAVRDALVEVLAFDGYRVATARDGDEALRVLRATVRPCVAIVDLVMPRVDGWALLAAVGAEAALRDVPVICSTAGRDDPPSGCHAVLRKPFDATQLLAAVRAAFAARR